MAQEIADSKLLDTWSSSGTKIEPDISKIIEGWQLGEQPPHEYMNWLQNTFGSKLNHILKNGVAEWNNETEYLAGSSVQHNGNVWLCKTTNTNSAPTDANNNWDKIPSLENLALTVDTIDDFPESATTGDTCIVKDLDRGGIFIYDSTKVSEDNGGTNFNGWIRQYSGAVNVKWFGAKGDGVTDDFSAINTALSVANGNRIIFDSGKKYRIGSPITFNGDVSLSTDGAEKAIIFHNGQSFTPLTISGTLSHTTTLTQSQQINNRDWVVANAGLVEKGMLMEVISSASWYHDPRPDATDARKSELHRVSSVSGNTISTEDIANDGYILPDETVTIKFYTPVSVSIENMAIHCVLPFPAESTKRVTGIRISYANEPLLMDIDVENAASTGIGFEGCYRPVCLRGHTHSSNNFFTGYGVQLYGSSHAIIRDRTFWQCRRGVDVSGAQVVSRHTLIENCTNLGGGINSKGEIYGWNDEGILGAPQFGFGSHGPADHTIYRGNRVVAQMHAAFNIRGRNEIIEDNYIIGRTIYGVISCTHGENIWIKNNKVYSGWSNLKTGIVVEDEGNINTRRANWFVRFASDYQGGNIVIENNDVQVQDRFVSFDSDSVQQSISISRNKVRYATQLSEDPVFFAYNEGTTQSISSWQILNNDYARESGTGTISLFNNLILDDKSNLGEVGSYTGTYTPVITNVLNVTSSGASLARYSVVGNIVTMMGGITLTFADANVNCRVRLSLPIPKDFVSSTEARLTGTPHTLNSRDVLSGQADITNNEIEVRCFPSAIGPIAFNYLAMYEI